MEQQYVHIERPIQHGDLKQTMLLLSYYNTLLGAAAAVALFSLRVSQQQSRNSKRRIINSSGHQHVQLVLLP